MVNVIPAHDQNPTQFRVAHNTLKQSCSRCTLEVLQEETLLARDEAEESQW